MTFPMRSRTYQEIAQAWGLPSLALSSIRQPYWMNMKFCPLFSSYSTGSSPESPIAKYSGDGGDTGFVIRFDSHWECECAVMVTYDSIRKRTHALVIGLVDSDGKDGRSCSRHKGPATAAQKALISQIRQSPHLVQHPLFVPTLLMSKLVQNQTDWIDLITPEINAIQDLLGTSNWKYGKECQAVRDSGRWSLVFGGPGRVFKYQLIKLRKLYARLTGIKIAKTENNINTSMDEVYRVASQAILYAERGRAWKDEIAVTEVETADVDSSFDMEKVPVKKKSGVKSDINNHEDNKDKEKRSLGFSEVIRRLNMIVDSIRFQAKIGTELRTTLKEMGQWLDDGLEPWQQRHIGRRELENGAGWNGHGKGNNNVEGRDRSHFAIKACNLEISETLEFLLHSMRGYEQRIQYRQETVESLISTVYALMAQRDSDSIRIVAVITLLFLPGTFTAVRSSW